MRTAARRNLQHVGGLAALLALAWIQLTVFVRDQPSGESWFLYGRDTLAHDAVVQLWLRQWWERDPGCIPLWAFGIQGGIPTVGSFLLTPFAPQVWLHGVLGFAAAQWAGWLVSLWIAGIGGILLGRAAGLRALPALAVGVVWMLSGHVVTLIHAGHFQKVMALGWMPWLLAGFLAAGRGAGLRPAVLMGGLGFGMIFLSGHPQIAFAGLITGVVLFAATTGKRWLRNGFAAGAMLAIGGLLSGAQLLPGLEMAGLSNRAGGVEFREAVETSYPPGELMEFVVPNWKGSSVTGDTYTGDWGERIVSDYLGALVLGAAALGLLAGSRRRVRLRLALAGIIAFWVLVGLGRHTPLYGFLYELLPGFRSFRSPGTFFCAAVLPTCLLTGEGVQRAQDLLPRRWSAGAAMALIVGFALSLMIPNRHYLFAFSGDRYAAEFASPRELDLWLSEPGRGPATHDVVSELSLRPILFGGTALNGYHPVFYAEKARMDRELELNSRAWLGAFGVDWLVIPSTAEVEGLPTVASFAQEGRRIVALNQPPLGIVWADGPSSRTALLNGSTRFPGLLGPGFVVERDGKREARITEVTSGLQLGPGVAKATYQSDSWLIGVYFTALGILMLSFMAAFRPKSATQSPS